MTQQQDCSFCKNLILQQRGLHHPHKIAELEVSTAVLRPTHQYYRGYTVLALRQHATELWELSQEVRTKFMEEANQLAAALNKAFSPVKMNYAILGNTVAHLHWHLVPRYHDDPNPEHPIWASPIPEILLSDEELEQIANDIRRYL